MGVKRRMVSKEEIIERLVYPMVNEGARILEEGIAARPGDIDTIWINGYNWPAWRGGPMHWADSVEVKDWYARMKSRPAFRTLLNDRVGGMPAQKGYTDLDF